MHHCSYNRHVTKAVRVPAAVITSWHRSWHRLLHGYFDAAGCVQL